VKRIPATFRRKKIRVVPQIVAGIAVLVFFTGIYVCWRAITVPSAYRQSVFVYGSPSWIISWNATKSRAVMMTIPSDVSVNALHRLGRYAVSSLYALDRMDAYGGKVFVGSIADAVGVPLTWYVDAQNLHTDDSDVDVLRRVFSWQSIFEILVHTRRTSAPFSVWVSWVLAASSLSADAVETVSIEQTFIRTELPDKSNVRILDENKFDYIVGASLLDAAIRNEDVSVSVYNTTDVPLVGSIAARQMGNIGIQLVFVGNAQSISETCEVYGASLHRHSVTVRFIQDYFSCTWHEGVPSGSVQPSDITVYLGKQYARRLLPR